MILVNALVLLVVSYGFAQNVRPEEISTTKCPAISKTNKEMLDAMNITIDFYYQSREQPMTKLSNSNLYIIDQSLPIKVIVPGWMVQKNILILEISTNYLKRGSYNIIVVDWSKYTDKMSYVEAAYFVNKIGKKLGKCLTTISTYTNIPFSKFHLIGFSLGAHVCGIAAKRLTELNGGQKVYRITGLDPAGPCFDSPKLVRAEHRLAATDANKMVDIIYSDAGKYSLKAEIGTVGFWPNGGHRSQPGCNKNNDLYINGFCSHKRAGQLFFQGILYDDLVATKCSSEFSFNLGLCKRNDKAVLGENTPQYITGNYYLKTNGESPYVVI